ncbi:hypothetical protein P8C59_001620 [Phyllachora maydis]|uniref:Uncharacterized protein n=1 Tax=Phyllachora maydis TaxID=1825666 RepID=A0AAD9MCG5_9PEZI|nr:hypothetical protein P8C59_001620 [Phyllachora maydis]
MPSMPPSSHIHLRSLVLLVLASWVNQNPSILMPSTPQDKTANHPTSAFLATHFPHFAFRAANKIPPSISSAVNEPAYPSKQATETNRQKELFLHFQRTALKQGQEYIQAYETKGPAAPVNNDAQRSNALHPCAGVMYTEAQFA